MKDKLNSIELKYGRHIEMWDKMASVFSDPEYVEGFKKKIMLRASSSGSVGGSSSSNNNIFSSYGAALENIVEASLIKQARKMKEEEKNQEEFPQ